MSDGEPLLRQHGGFRQLKSFQLARLVYDITVRFCDRYVARRSRTHDQMVQAARSGVQNIAEGSQASGTSRKFELKLTNVARASLEELRLDYEDFLRQRGLPILPQDHPVLLRFKALRCDSLVTFRGWVAEERVRVKAGGGLGTGNTDLHGPSPTDTDRELQHQLGVPLSSACLAANGALSLLNLTCFLLDRQIKRLAQDFEKEGGFTERLYRVRRSHRAQKPKP